MWGKLVVAAISSIFAQKVIAANPEVIDGTSFVGRLSGLVIQATVGGVVQKVVGWVIAV